MASLRVHVRLGVALAAIGVLLALPVAAFAANTASYSSALPKPASRSTVTRPTVSVSVYDRYGVKGSSSSAMTLDGRKVKPSVAYTKRGDYRRFKMSYRVTSDLAVGSHKAVVTVTDVKHKRSTYSWTFVVVAPAPVDMPVTIADTSCSTCHTGYPAAHPMTNCQLCHGATAPPRPASSGIHPGGQMSSFTPADTSAHTLGCMLESPCHGGGGDFPHTLDTNCARCHTGTYAGIPAAHGPASTVVHVSTSTFCTRSGCHHASLTLEHYQHVVGGARLSCATCHASTDPTVVSAIRSGSTDCASCHDFGATTHPATSVVHATPTVACTASGCHAGADLARIHKGNCAACHAPGKTASSDCTTCHGAQPHSGLDAVHAAPVIDCTAAGCHGTSVITIHTAPGGPGCAACHGAGKTPSLVCAACHPGGVSVVHVRAPASHATSGTCIVSGCHPSDAASIHSAPGGPGCAACHAAGKTPSTTCATCHAAGTYHPGAAALHANPTPGCVVDGCHAADVSTIHVDAGVGCSACHAAGKTPSTTCATCHAADPHASVAASHIAANACTSGTGCHVPDVTHVHKGACADCHAPGKTPSTQCWTCHGDGHAAAATAHVSADDCANSGCHAGSVTAIHKDACIDCHAEGKTPSTVCANCHPTGHGAVLQHATRPSCTGAICHGTDVSVIHAAAPAKCLTCHGAGKVPTADCTNAACHPVLHDLVAAHAATVTSSTIRIAGIGYGTHACSECHASTDLRTIHGGDDSCPTCHPSVVAALGGDWRKSCVQGGCHTSTSTAPMHANINVEHTTDPSVTASCGGSGCHGNVTTVAAIHANHGGCVDCHAAGKTPSVVCADCHVPHDLVSAHAASPAADTIEINGTSYGPHACSECHTASDLRTVHGGDGSCATCHPTAVAALGGDWNKSCVQGGCHTATSTKPMHANVDALHTLGSAPTCVASGCHAGGLDAAAIHGVAGGPGCAACHGAGKTPSTQCSACHNFTDHTSQHSVTRTDTCAAAECHGSGDTNLTTIHTGGCATCHGVGAPATAKAAIAAGNKDCANCHGFTNHTTQHAVTRSDTCAAAGCHGNTDTNLITIHNSNCDTCHGTNAPAQAATSIANHDKVCADCHGFSDHTTQHAVTPIAACITCHSDTNLIAIHVGGCTTCHGSTDPAVATAITTHNKVCSACHTTEVSSATLHPTYAAAHNASVPGCTAAGCHTGGSDAAAIHTATGGPGCTACHGSGKTPSLTCETPGCHPYFSLASHMTPHDYCNQCHADAVSAESYHSPVDVTTTSNCQSCHGSPPVHPSAGYAYHGYLGLDDCDGAGCHW